MTPTGKAGALLFRGAGGRDIGPKVVAHARDAETKIFNLDSVHFTFIGPVRHEALVFKASKEALVGGEVAIYEAERSGPRSARCSAGSLSRLGTVAFFSPAQAVTSPSPRLTPGPLRPVRFRPSDFSLPVSSLDP